MRSENKALKIQFLMRACMKNVSVSHTGYVAGDFFDIKGQRNYAAISVSKVAR